MADTWVLSDGKAGTENQALGLAEAVGLPVTLKRLAPRPLWRAPPAALWTLPLGSLPLLLVPGPGSAPLDPPWPSLLIAAGKPSVGPAIAIRRAARGRTVVVQVQDPRVDPAHFDLIAAPRHDRLHGPNIMETRGALHRVTAQKLREAEREFAVLLGGLPRPLVAVLIGGTSAHYRLTPAVTRRLIQQLQRLQATTGAGLAVTASRRTGEANAQALRAELRGNGVFFWDGTGANPYFGLLALADYLVVTEDSVSMASEAASTGKPVFTVPLEGGSPKFDRFHAMLRADGVTRPFTGDLDHWAYAPLDDTAQVAARVKSLLAERGRTGPDMAVGN